MIEITLEVGDDEEGALERCPYCGMMTPTPCDEPPPDYCHVFAAQ